ncbi:ubiquitin carboxyl-terminal hydrolase 36-like [Montipora capricornis]|uniref:ubiquitin carboxyl-terminal hydrolase 36-like n=1 Tax=Montipora capricornis TaxID=246305 RepID=UPI0035F1F473
MSSVAVQVMPSPATNFSKDSLIANKLAADLDAKLVSSSKKVLLQRIEFKPASKPDEQYENLRNKYVPLNSQSHGNKLTNGKQEHSLLRSQARRDANDDLPSPKVVLFPEEKVELHWKLVRRVGPGLSNMGNTCFLNSVLQVLTYTPPLVNYLTSKEHSEKCRSVGFCMLCELQKHVFRGFGHHQGEAIKPMAIIQKLKFIAKHLRFGHQEDAHEFLRYVIDGMQKSCLAAEGYTDKLDRMSKQTTMVHQVFGGYYRSQVQCLKCRNNSNTFDPLMDIMLDVKHVPSVEKALQRSIKLELLDGENLYMCPRCKRKVPAHKQFLIHRAPNILTLQLKRFDYNQMFGGKISKQVEYAEYLDLRPYMTSKGPPIKYRLYAVLVHSGYSSNSGHYYCYVRASNGVWYQMNDSMVRQVALKSVLSQQAYLLFYTKHASSKQESQSLSMDSPKTPSLPKNPVTPSHVPKVIKENDVGTPVKPGIYFRRTPSTTSTVTKPSTSSTAKQTPTVPLVSPSQRSKFSFTIPLKSKGVTSKTDLNKTKTDVDKTKAEEREPGEKDIKGKVDDELAKASTENASQADPKSPITSSEKNLGTGPGSESAQTSAKEDDVCQVQKLKEPLAESVPLKKEEKEKADSPPKKPRPPPLFIPRPVAQGKGTPVAATRATTPWKVTAKTTAEPQFGPMSPPPPALLPRQQSPSSAMSDASSTSSIMGKTGEWTVTDKTALTPGPRLPERQYAGWQVSKRTGDERGDVDAKKDREEKRENGEEIGSTKKKKKHKKEKKKKKEKEKSKKKYERLWESDDSETERKKRKRKKDKYRSKQTRNTDEQENVQGEKFKSGKHKRKHKACDEEEGDGAVSRKKPCLVTYESSSSSSSEQIRSSYKTDRRKSAPSDSRGSSSESRVPVIHDENDPKKSRGSRRATWDGSRDSSTVVQLLSAGKGLHGYGSSVTSWEGGKSIVDSTVGESSHKRQRRDSWDDDYDRGKEKKIKKSKDKRKRCTNGNPFQREYEKGNTKQSFKGRFSGKLHKNNPLHQSQPKSRSSKKHYRWKGGD